MLWKIKGIGHSGKPVTITILASNYQLALQRFHQRHQHVRIISVVKQD